MKENAIKFLYAIECYLLYMLSGVVASAVVVAYYSTAAALNYDISDSAVFVEYIADFVSGKASVVLIVSYCIIFLALLIVFAIQRRRLTAYTGMSHMHLPSAFGAAVLGVVLNLITYALTPSSSENSVDVNSILLLCAIIGPFVEELVFRGVLLKMFAGSCRIFAATIITSALFALSHAEPVQMIYTFLLGIILCIVRVRSTSLWSPVVLHLSFNITGAVSMMYNPKFSNNELIFLCAAGLAFFIIACTGGRKLKET